MNEHQTIEARFYDMTGQMLSTAIEEIGGDYRRLLKYVTL
jgi:hypothetical protein